MGYGEGCGVDRVVGGGGRVASVVQLHKTAACTAQHSADRGQPQQSWLAKYCNLQYMHTQVAHAQNTLPGHSGFTFLV